MSPHPKCPVCKHHHRLGEPHIYDDEPKDITVTLPGEKPTGYETGENFPVKMTPTKLFYQGVEIIPDAAIAQQVEREPSKLQAESSILSGRSITESRLAEDAILISAIDKAYPKPSFDRAKYQREYMRDRVKAKALGLTVAAWREKFGGKDEL
jgi:hypothetical protein